MITFKDLNFVVLINLDFGIIFWKPYSFFLEVYSIHLLSGENPNYKLISSLI